MICANGNDLPEGEYCRACGIDDKGILRMSTLFPPDDLPAEIAEEFDLPPSS
jgi:hypothetical protein